MKKISHSVLLAALIILVRCSPLPAYQIFVVDPGHGGPGGGKYGQNGDGFGAAGQNGLTEEWVNLEVAKKIVEMNFNDPSWGWVVCLPTRDEDTIAVSLWDRLQFAKYYDALYFLSVHHNGDQTTVQGTQVWWSSRALTESLEDTEIGEHNRNADSRDSTYAKKLLLRLREAWRYRNYCTVSSDSNSVANCDEYVVPESSKFVLKNIYHCFAALSEASCINTYAEEALFANEYSGHAEQEATALYAGSRSHSHNMGFARVSNRFIGGPGQAVGVDGVEWNTPVEFTWEYAEQHELIAWQNFYFNGYGYSFHHWAHLSCDDCFIDSFHVSRYYDVTVPYEFEEHIYRAYFAGGPYYAEVAAVPDPFRYASGDTVQFIWYTTAGVDSTALVSLYLDRQNGAQGYPELLAEDVPWKQRGYLNWVVTGPASEQCRLKVVSHDIAGNQAAEVADSWNTFAVCTFLVGDANGDGAYTVSDAPYIISYIFGNPSGPPPTPHPIGSGDADCNHAVSISDAVRLINYIFSGGQRPGSTCDCANYD